MISRRRYIAGAVGTRLKEGWSGFKACSHGWLGVEQAGGVLWTEDKEKWLLQSVVASWCRRRDVLDLGVLMYPRKNNAEPLLSAYNMRGTLKKFPFVPAVGSSIQRLGNRLLHNCSLTISCQGTGPYYQTKSSTHLLPTKYDFFIYIMKNPELICITEWFTPYFTTMFEKLSSSFPKLFDNKYSHGTRIQKLLTSEKNYKRAYASHCSTW